MMCEYNTDYVIKSATQQDIESIQKAFPGCEITSDANDYQIFVKNPTKGYGDHAFIVVMDLSKKGMLFLEDIDITIYYDEKDRTTLIEQIILMWSGYRVCDVALDDVGYKACQYHCCITDWEHYLDDASLLANTAIGKKRYDIYFMELCGPEDGEDESLLWRENNILELLEDKYSNIGFCASLVRPIGTDNVVLSFFTPI